MSPAGAARRGRHAAGVRRLSLAKHAHRAASLFDAITVSLDGTNRATYRTIRGVDAFAKVCEGVRTTAGLGARLGVRVTLQRANYRQLPQFVALARELGVQQLSFVAVDVASSHAFGRGEGFTADLALQPPDLPVLAQLIDEVERGCAADFDSGLIADSPRKVRRIHQYFAAACGQADFPAVHCNVFDYSAVIGATGRVSPCFFISGPSTRSTKSPITVWPTSSPTAGSSMAKRTSRQENLRATMRSSSRPLVRA
jgi:Fe-coproporphyrin III synthase